MLSSMRPKEKAAFLLDLRALSASPAWLFAGEFERVDVERVRVEVVLREILPSEALDLCQQTFGCEASAVRVTLRRPANQPLNCGACAPAEVELELELADSRARRLSQRRMRCKQGCLPDAVELALPWLGVGQRCELSGRLDLERLAAPEEAACLRVLLLARGEPVPLEEVEQQAKVLFKAKRFLPALLLLTAADHPHASQAWLRRRCHCELRLGLAAAAASSARLVARRPSAQHLLLRARARLSQEPAEAVKDIERAAQVDATCRHQKLLSRAQWQLKRQQRARRWFDGNEAFERSREANSSQRCFQCQRLRAGHMGSGKMEGRYLCTECWECWSKIRRCQQAELERRIEKATYSDYSTGTEELPSLDDVPQDWDSRHPMWNRENLERPDWQLRTSKARTKAHRAYAAWPCAD
ncbi:unnamed protein product [Effrenium voratum]|uniref:Uncharacterized protein n=1 Tax=Effrenium voratum TaxID=2562239 RepID=A0AA36N7Q5_9DINO|nr:unnamed protein product [Effrenium voratum]